MERKINLKTIAILNLKGGVGKTVTAINMASILAIKHGKRVLAIDADSQSNLTEFFLGDVNQPVGLVDVLKGNGCLAFCTSRSDIDNLDVLPACDRLMELDLSAVADKSIDPMRLHKALQDNATKYDYCIIDCPPAFSASCAAAILAADEVIIPIKLDAFSLRGMGALFAQVRSIQHRKPVRIRGCLETMWFASDAMEAADCKLRDSSVPVFKTRIRRTGMVDGMTFAQSPLCIYSPKSAAGVDYRRFVAEYLEGE